MTTESGAYQENDWDEARIALGRVADLLRERESVRPEELRGVENYGLIPAGVRETLESLSPEEQDVVKRLIVSLAANHFYIENGEGGLAFY
jgi:hypothetical protein